MKNIFKFMGIALMACSLTMVSCNKDKDDEGGSTAANTATVNFGGNEWEATVGQASTANYAQYGIVQYMLFKTEGNYPAVNLMISGNPGSYSATSEVGEAEPNDYYPNGYNYYNWGGGYDLYRVDYLNSGAVQTQQGVRGDWAAKSAELTVSAFDANSMTASFNLTAVMYDFAGWYNGNFDDATDAEEKNLTVNVNEYTFTAAQ